MSTEHNKGTDLRVIALAAVALISGCDRIDQALPPSDQCQSVWRLRDQILAAEKAGQMAQQTIESLATRQRIMERAQWCTEHPQGIWL